MKVSPELIAMLRKLLSFLAVFLIGSIFVLAMYFAWLLQAFLRGAL